jgi:hypothetical protein
MEEKPETGPDMSIEDAVATLVSDLPQPIRDFVVGPERDAVSLALTKKHNLHVDQAAAFEHAYLYMLLGINTPENFTQELADAGIDDTTVNALATDINEMVFKPLRARMQVGAASPPPTPPASTYPAPLVPPMKLVDTPAPAPLPAPVPPSTPIPPPAPVSLSTPPPAPISPPPIPVPTPLQQPVPATPSGSTHEETYAVRTMGRDIEAVKEHRLPEPVSMPAHHSTLTAPPLPPRPASSDAARTAPPPPNLPGTPLEKQYAVDPYREPME